MRDLTEEELKLAPDWVTHYIIYEFDISHHCIVFYDSDWLQWVYIGDESWSPKMTSQRMPLSAMPIPSKVFDITKHEFSEGISISNMCKLSVEVEFKDNDDCNYVPLNKDDVIAIAKALGVTGGDLLL